MIDYNKQLIVITAPSGAGKSTVINSLVRRNKIFCFSVSHTTRAVREKEREGVNYYYVSRNWFEQNIKKNYFLEWALVHENYYGTSYQEIDNKIQAGKKIILDIDVQGALLLQKQIKAIYIFISISSLSVLKERLYKRDSDSDEAIKKRLINAEKEIAFASTWPNVVQNDIVDETVLKIENLIFNIS